jgi:hypothetical protein
VKPKEPTNHRPPPGSKAGLSRETAAMVGVGCGLVGGGEESQGSRLAVEGVEDGGGGDGGRRWRLRGSATNKSGGAKLPPRMWGGEGKRTGGKQVKKNHQTGGCVGWNGARRV